jgi:hypothetical protein
MSFDNFQPHRQIPSVSHLEELYLSRNVQTMMARAAVAGASPDDTAKAVLEIVATNAMGMEQRLAAVFSGGEKMTVAALRYPITSGNFGTAGKISWSGMSSAVRVPQNSRGTRSAPDMHGDRLHAGGIVTTSPDCAAHRSACPQRLDQLMIDLAEGSDDGW